MNVVVKEANLFDTIPFSKALLDVYHRVKNAKTLEERSRLMAHLAALFHSEHDSTNHKCDEASHEVFEDYEQARMNFHQMTLRLARLALNEVEEALETSGLTPLGNVVETEKTSN